MKLLEQIKDAIREHYILVDKVDEVIDQLDKRAVDLHDNLDPHRLSHSLTVMLQDITNDKHFAVAYRPPTEDKQEAPATFAPNFARNNNFFYEAKRLAGNIGYLDFRLFPAHQEAMETAIGAMAMLANTDALIFDVRYNRGGSPAMIVLLLSYLTDEYTHLNSFQNRSTDELWQTWTMPYVPGKKYLHKPIYVLTSQMTGSAAEEFSYDLQQLEWATLVGQTTAGAGHTVSMIQLDDGYSINVSSGRPINPISKTGWEGEGVHPHIETEIGKELSTAHLHAMDSLLEKAADEPYKHFLKWEKLVATAIYQPYTVDDVSQYVGQYENIAITQNGNTLHYQSNQIKAPLTPIEEGLFGLLDGIRVRFEDSSLMTEWRDTSRQITFQKTS